MKEKDITARCPVTGFQVGQTPQWMKKKIKGYVYAFTKIGDSIVLVANKGDMKDFRVKTHYELFHKFANENAMVYPLVEIRDVKNLKGKPTSEEMKNQKTYFLEKQNRFAGFIICNMPFWLRAVVMAGLKRYNVSVEFLVFRTREEALKKAELILEKSPVFSDEGPEEDFTYEMLEFAPQWQYENKEEQIFYRSGVIPGKLFFSSIQAKYLDMEDFNSITPFFKQIFKEGMFTDSRYIRMVDYSRMQRSSTRLKKAYAKMQIELHKTYRCSPSVTYICGANLFVKTSLKLFSAFVNQRFVFLDSVEHAFDLINQERRERKKQRNIIVSQKDIEQINNLCGMLVWDEEEAKIGNEIEVSPDNKLYELYETISLVRTDLIELRLREIAQARELKKALKAAETANQAKTDFLSNMSHELLTPLNGITGMLDMVSDTPLSKEQTEYTRTARSCADQLQTLVSGIFEFMSLSRGELAAKDNDFDLEAVMEEIERFAQLRLKKQEVVFEYTVDKDVPNTLFGDSENLKKILYHIVGNALKFVDQGSVDVQVTNQDETQDHVSLLFEVTDTGIGIPKDRREGLFDLFTQADTSTTRKHDGAGLGLSITKRLVDLLEGDIGFDSQQGKGSRFWFRVEYQKSESQNVPVKESSKAVKNDRQQQILVVDDNRMNQKVAGNMLKKMGYRISLADNGRQAVDMYAPGKFDLIFMDLQMPVMGGEEAVKNIRIIEKESKTHTPIIALTANTTDTARKISRDAGMDAFLTKPLKKNLLTQEMKKFIQ